MEKENIIQNSKKQASIYQEIFLKVNEVFLEKFNAQKKHLSCKNCDIYQDKCPNIPKNPTQHLPKECIYRFWQENCLDKLEKEISNSILAEINILNAEKEKYHCQKCAACCKLASSEFSYEELQEKAKNGDIFAQQFTSIFVPYENKELARPLYPEFFEALESKYGKNGQIYFYHCLKIADNNLCTDYDNRPDICRNFPSSPLVLFPKECGYRKWQDEVDVKALTIHAMMGITDFYKDKIKSALND